MSGSMSSESVASCPQPLPASPVTPSPVKAQSAPKNTPERVTPKGACFFCNEEGHWVRDCPNRSNPTPGRGSPKAGRCNYPELQCPCGLGRCIVLTSRTVKNPGREFYRCPGKQSEQCGFFKWCDEATSGQIPKLKSPMKPRQQNNVVKLAGHHGKQLNDADHSSPMCSCGAGKCILATMQDGENAGRKYFACPIKKGQGACSHFQWYGSAMKALKIEEEDDGLTENPNLPTHHSKNPCRAIDFDKVQDLNLIGPRASTRERDSKDSHNSTGEGACNHFLPFDDMKKISKIEHPNKVLDKSNPLVLDNKEVRQAIDAAKVEDIFAPISPLLDQQEALLHVSPVKRLSLGDDGSSKEKRCVKYGGEKQWSKEFNVSLASPCFKCERCGHSKHNGHA